MSWVAVAVGGSAALGYVGSQDASRRMSNSANDASRGQMEMFNQTRDDLAPYRNAGPVALSELMTRLGLGGSGGPAPNREQFTRNIPGTEGHMGVDPSSGSTRSMMYIPGTPGSTSFDQAGFDKATAASQPQGGGANSGQLLKPFGMEDFQASPAYQFNLQEGEKAINKAANAKGNLYAPQTLQDLGKYSQGLASNEFQNAYSNYNNNLNNIWNKLYGISSMGQSAANQTGAFGANTANQVGANTIGAGNAGAAGVIGGTNALTGGIESAYNQYLLNSVLQGQKGTYGMGSGGNFSGQG